MTDKKSNETVPMSCHGTPSDTDSRMVIQPNKEALLKRINRITGQIQGVYRMVEQDRYCVDILTQVSAIKSAMDGVAMQLIEDHTHHCVKNAIQSGQGDSEISELVEIIRKYTK